MDKKFEPHRFKDVEKKGFWDCLLALILGSLVVIMFIQVFCRYVLNNSLSWSEELTKYLFVWMTFLGGALCLRDKIHIGVDYFVSLLPKYFRNAIRQFNLLLIIIFSFVVAVAGFVWVLKTRGTFTPALGWPLNIVFYAAVPVGCMMTVFYGIRRLISEFKNEEQG